MARSADLQNLKQRIYWTLPYTAKCWVASSNARRLDQERHGPWFDRAVASIREHETWHARQLAEHQTDQLKRLVRHAAQHVPHYRDLFGRIGIDPASISSLESLQKLPILEKSTVRERGRQLLDERLNAGHLIVVNTSGTTGSPLTLFSDVRANSARYAFAEERWHGEASVRRLRDPSVSVGGHLVASPGRDRPPFWVLNRRWKQLYMSSYHLSEKNLGSYVGELRRFGGAYIEGYPSSLYQIARYILDHGLEPLRFQACFTTAEVLYEHQRETFREAFRCQTFNQYGCAEFVVFASECRYGSLHLSPEVGIVEVLDENDRPVREGEVGQLVCTGLINWAQPLIRYRVGDLAAVVRSTCSCGSARPVLKALEGRMDDVLIGPDGRRVGRLDPVFKGVKGVAEAQIIQDSFETFIIRIVPGPGFEPRVSEHLRANLAARLGPGARIEVVAVDSIERTRNGKLRAVVSRLPEAARKPVAGTRDDRSKSGGPAGGRND